MWAFLSRNRDAGILVMRVGLAFVFIWAHGWPKLAGGVSKWRDIGGAMGHLGVHFWPVFWGLAATLAETLGALLMGIGLFFKPACMMLGFTMTVAAIHECAGKGTWRGDGAHAIEMAIVFYSLMFIGAGKYSIDKD